MSTKPGVTNAPSASIVRVGRRRSTVADLDDAVAVDRDVAGERGARPVPSTTVPPRITRSWVMAGGSRTRGRR